ncbi:MAG: hypothetical protein JNL83_28365 [Myxococcales bacterium]|nr:hypothetical protein [Myxococcales bacterium]
MPPRRIRRASAVDLQDLLKPPWYAQLARWLRKAVPPREPSLRRRGRWPVAKRVRGDL